MKPDMANLSEVEASAPKAPPEHARVVIIGGGIIGCSIAYHLVELGWRDVVLLERAQLTSGTTWHAAGLLTTPADPVQSQLANYSRALYRRLESETGQATGVIECGSIQLATTPQRAEEMRRSYRRAQSLRIECEEIGPEDVARFWPLAYVDDIKAAFYFPRDCRGNPTDITRALAKGARIGGVRIIENCVVTGVETHAGRVKAVRSTCGRIETDFVVNCAGIWAREVGRLAGVDVPLQAAEHYYMISEPVAGVHTTLPILRDPDRSTYIREEAGKLLVGLHEPAGKPWRVDGIPSDFTFGEIPPDWDRIHPYLARATERVPLLSDTGIKVLFCGPEAYTPDHNYLIGEAPGLNGYFVAAGFNSGGILVGGGVGRVMAQWIVQGHAPMDLSAVDIRRTDPWQNNSRYLADRIVETLGVVYQDHWPFRQWQTARGVKKCVLHDRLASAGACFGESAGWERPNWYARPGQKAEYVYSWGRQNWFENCVEEHRAVREHVGLFDQSSFAKFLVQGRDAEQALNRIATAECRVPVGRAVYTHFLNEHGGIEADVTVTRLTEHRFLVVTAAFTATRVGAWLEQHIDSALNCIVTDVSDGWCMINLQGPRSRELLAAVAPGDWSSAGFPFSTAREVEIGYQKALAMRLSATGELGWELYVPVPFALGVYDALVEAGRPLGLRHCGYHALASLTIEKAHRIWPFDIGPDDTPLEAGLSFTCAWNKSGGFIGREALLKARAAPPKRKLAQFLLLDPEPLLHRGEPILRDGQRVGLISSGMYGHTLRGAVGLGYVSHPDGVSEALVTDGRFEILIGNRTVPARASLRPLYDPSGARARA